MTARASPAQDVPIPDVDLTKDDLDQSGWEQVIASVKEKECFYYARPLFAKASAAGDSGETKSEAVFALLGYLAQLRFVHDHGDAAFATTLGDTPRDNSALSVIRDNHVEALGKIVGGVQDPEMRARIADVLWIRTRGPEYARTAVTAYLESVRLLEDPRHWPPVKDRLLRAASIGAQLGRNNEPFKNVMAHLEAILDRHNGEDPLYLSVSCMEILLTYQQGNPAKHAALCQKMTEKCSPVDSDRAQRIWFLKAEWHKLAGEHELAREARIKAAEVHVRQAGLHAAGTKPSHALAAECIRRAIGVLRKVDGTGSTRQELHKLLLDYQQKSLAELKQVYGEEINLSDCAQRAREAVRKKSFAEAIRILALGLFHPKAYAKVRAETEQMRDEHSISFLFTTHLLDHEGRTAAKSTPRRGQRVPPAEAALLSRMHSNTRDFEHSIYAQGVVNPARQQILLEHNACLADWHAITQASPFVPPGRERLWALALHAGLVGDVPSMLHILVPQLEHSFRYLLQHVGVTTSTLSDDGIQEDWDMKRLLDHPELTKVLGPDYVFHLRCLLVERFGSNLRNRTAHGLLSDQEVHSWNVLYLWWLGLRLCVHPIVVAERGSADESTTEQNEAQAGDASFLGDAADAGGDA